jgi:hypothetical protein
MSPLDHQTHPNTYMLRNKQLSMNFFPNNILLLYIFFVCTLVPWQCSTITFKGSVASQEVIEEQTMNMASKGGQGNPGNEYSITYINFVMRATLKTYRIVKVGNIILMF